VLAASSLTFAGYAERERIASRAKVLAELKAWLQRDGETLQ
jgi:hypothetical protein